MAILYLRYKESEIPVLLHTVLCILAYLLWIILILAILPLFLVFQIIRLSCYTLTCFFDSGQPVELSDLPFVLDCEFNPYIIVGIVKIKGKLNANEIKKLFTERILAPFKDSPILKKLREYITCSYNTYVWKPSDFNLDNHIYQADKIIEGNDDEVRNIFVKMTQEQFTKQHAPWKVVVYNTYDDRYTFMFSAVHHALGDGFSLQALFTYLYDERPTFLTPSRNQGVLTNMYHRIVRGILTGPLVITTILFSRYYENPFYTTNCNKMEDRCFSWNIMKLDLVKDIKNYTKSTVNDVLLTVLSKALTRYLTPKHDISELPIVISFNSRSYQDLLKDKHQLRNCTGGSFMSLPLKIDHLQALDTIRRRTGILKSSPDGHAFEFIFSKIIGLLPAYMAKLAASSLREHCSLLVSNVPGPIDSLYINGLEVENIITTPPLMYDLGVSIGFFTYSNQLYVTILSRKSVLPDPYLLSLYFQQELQNMHYVILRKLE